MPVVQKYGPEKTALAPLPGVRKTAAETPLSEGAGVAASDEQKWNALEGIGEIGMKASLDAYKTIAGKARDQADEVARLDWQNKLAKFTQDTIYDPQQGVLTVKGQDAMGLPPRVSDAYNNLADSIASGLSNDRQRLQFAKDRQERQQSIDLTVLRHVDEQIQTYHASELQSTIENAQNLAISNAQDPASAARELARGADALRTSGPQVFGWGPEDVQKHVQDFYSAGHVGIIGNLLDNKKTAAAKVYYEEAKDQINGVQRGPIEKALQVAGTTQAGLDTSTELWSQLGPKSDDEPIQLDVMENAARDKFQNDPESYEATVKFLRERKAAVDASRTDRAEQTAGDVWIAASKGASLDTISRMPQFRALPGRQQAQVTDYIVGKIEHVANLAASEESRAAARENRLYTAEQRAEVEKTKAGWVKYWDLASQPAVLDKTSVNAIQALRGDLGDEHVNRLLTQKLTLAKGDEAVRAATIDEDLFKTIANTNGVAAYGTLSDDQKADVGRLRNTVETEIDRAQQAKGKLLTREEKQKLMQSIIDQKVYVSTWFGFSHDEKIAAMVSEDDRQAAYVPLEKIPAPAVNEAMNYLRSLSPVTARMSDAQIRATYTDRIQKAYALRLMGRSRGEMEAILQGKQ